jgi:sugar phosphate isomerase/epimerase
MDKKVYAQIYSLLRQEREGLLDAIKKIAEIGYDGIEGIGTNTGGLSIPEFKKYLSDLGLDAISFHSLTTEEELAFAVEMGARFVDIRFNCHTNQRDDILRGCEDMNAQGKLRKKLGLTSALHNHAEEFRWVFGEEGKTRIFDLILENTDPEYISFELDVGWAARTGVKPEKYIAENAGRFPLLHAKEATVIAANEDEYAHFPKYILDMGKPTFVNGVPRLSQEQMDLMYASRSWNGELGKGVINWKAIKDAAEAQGVAAYINEREYYHIANITGDPVECAKLDYKFLRAL